MALKQFNQFVKQFSNSLPPSLEEAKSEFLEQLHLGLTLAFEKLDIVTRQEFDTQAELLTRTRQKLEVLEKKLSQLEQLQLYNSSESHNK